MKWKSVSLLVASGMVLGITCYAASGIEKIQAYLNHDIKITVNGKLFIPKDGEGVPLTPVILDGNSYLPTKAVAEALGANVKWNNATQTIIIDTSNAIDETKIDDIKIQEKVKDLKDSLQVGMTQTEVKNHLSEKYKVVEDNGDLENGSDSHWKYNFFVQPGYSRNDIPDHVIDEEGLKNGKIGLTLFIGWKNEKIHMYTIAYLKGDKVILYIVNSDGTNSENPV